ncbi:MAG TPA: RDD family protein [Myxococcales bacterium]|nr:RDD family protein [Myxococcales bacterium]
MPLAAFSANAAEVPPAADSELREAPALQSVQAHVAPRWRRLLAWVADLAALAMVVAMFLWVATRMVHHGSPSRQTGLDWLAETLLSYRKLWIPGGSLAAVLAVLYLTLFTALGGQTPGKRLLGLRVIDRAGGCPSPLRSGFRAAFAVASGALGLFGFFLVLVDRRGQALHDKLAGTFVVVGR